MSQNPLDMGSLRPFDVVARHGNLSRAAAALGTTQPALSYRIKQMEELLGVPLFRRRPRGLELTPEGEALQLAVRQGLERIDEAVQSICRRARTPTVRLATDFAFAAFRLMPRVADFRRANSGVDIHIVAAQSLAPEIADDIDLAVLFGDRDDFAEDFGGSRDLLIPERVVPVCAPGFLKRCGPFTRVEQLLDVPLIHLDGTPESGWRWFTWESWLRQAGVAGHPRASSLGFNTYTLVMQAVLAEQGVALGWYGLVDDLLATGAVVQACDCTLSSERGYWLLRRRGKLSPEAELVVDWLSTTEDRAA
ncbi:LysR substrate-binding domain-containing protein [Pelagibius marinus]|uniref:LysR substrate-binding domain-containing protein n=1 Tax=Pelagibius marinus TaxID=2762760 RepID=UPI00187273AA|nr:LysR substrate-binding domain-containing protein [Pelagibius marinus]